MLFLSLLSLYHSKFEYPIKYSSPYFMFLANKISCSSVPWTYLMIFLAAIKWVCLRFFVMLQIFYSKYYFKILVFFKKNNYNFFLLRSGSSCIKLKIRQKMTTWFFFLKNVIQFIYFFAKLIFQLLDRYSFTL